MKPMLDQSVSDIHFQNAVTTWSQFDELIRFVRDPSMDGVEAAESTKIDFIQRQVQLLNTPKNQKVYNKNDLCQAFSWYTVSTSLYNRLRSCIQLPAKSILQKITRTAKNMKDDSLFHLFFDKQPERSKNCIIIVEEVYVKASLTYFSGTLFGYAADQEKNGTKLASTLLCIMVKCFFTYETMLVSMTPCHALTADFLFHEVTSVVKKLELCGGRVHAFICDNNRVNQKCFSMFTLKAENTPWEVDQPADSARSFFLIYDPVHLIKNIRNNWMTEKLQTLKFFYGDLQERFARWSHLKELFDHEAKTITKLSKLTSSSVSPSNLEHKKVALALNVFSDQTALALQNSEAKKDTWEMTAMFILKVVKLWKVLNCKSMNERARLKDDYRVAKITMKKTKGWVF
ncbi:transposable element p transposase [Plakobranchus ocellatus]|uniref:Transposable element p transposase n=1 Tax=Plakobranchus ocellatus TaxID=259542 RepID=A0AAV4CAK2_9GAST|nr:transposable element p transposase [Plakobranchus ocellatus]